MTEERGSAPIESLFAIVMLVVMTLGTLQVAFVLYARNILASAAHEAVRAAVERGTGATEAEPVAAAVVARSAGRLIGDLQVVARRSSDVVTVHVRGETRPLGPVLLTIPLSASATAFVER